MVQSDSLRKTHIDFLRGIAMIGVVFANFNAYFEQQVPPAILAASSNEADSLLMLFNSVFLEWKFMSLFSILFGVGFGVIMQSVEKSGSNPNLFFFRRLIWLFLFGLLHVSFWLGDVLHLYAMSGVLLLLFRRWNPKPLLAASLILTFLPSIIMAILVNHSPTVNGDKVMEDVYIGLLSNDLAVLFNANFKGYYDMYIATGANWHDIPETLGRFLFGYWLLKSGLLDALVASPGKLKRIAYCLAIPVALYWGSRWMMLTGSDLIPQSVFVRPFLKIGIFLNVLFYTSLALIVFIKAQPSTVVTRLICFGKMTLTHYLSVSTFLILLLYGIGLGLISKIHISQLWMIAMVWVPTMMWVSEKWLSSHRYGPAEWIWRQLSWMKRMPNKRH
jgi:uncharacterized protein